MVWIVSNNSRDDVLTLLDPDNDPIRKLEAISAEIDLSRLPPKKQAVGEPSFIIYKSLSGVLLSLDTFLDRLLKSEWRTEHVPSDWNKKVLYASDFLADIETVFHRTDRLIDDIQKWLPSIFFTNKDEQRQDADFKRLVDGMRYSERCISKPTNFLKHNQTNLSTFTFVAHFDFESISVNLPGFYFSERRGKATKPVNRPELGLQDSSLTAFAWLVISVVLRIADLAADFISAKISRSRGNITVPSVASKFDAVALKLFKLPIYSYSDSVFLENSFVINDNSLMLDQSANSVFGCLYRPWSSATKIKLDQFGSFDPVLGTHTINVKRKLHLHYRRVS